MLRSLVQKTYSVFAAGRAYVVDFAREYVAHPQGD